MSTMCVTVCPKIPLTATNSCSWGPDKCGGGGGGGGEGVKVVVGGGGG